MKRLLPFLVVSLAFIAGVWLFTNSWEKKLASNNSIHVTGMYKVDFTSDLIVWRGSFNKKSMQMKEAYAALKKDEELIKNYLIEKGIDQNSIIFSSVDINQDYEYYYDEKGRNERIFTGYRLSQNVKIESRSVALVEQISRQITELIDRGVEFYSNQPEYFYTNLSELKIEMVAKATQDGRERASQIAENSGNKLGNLVSAQMGVFQITGQNSSENYSWGGAFNTLDKDKSASITIRLKFEIQ